MATAFAFTLPREVCLMAASAPSMRGWMLSAPGVAMNSATSPLGTSSTMRLPISNPET